ncbi:unnamed protein product [Phyllotreta striolata]|uniref:Arrestin C-terminal-like domain-containing protein n=1 Tax=Phyllotreta striolata TaxID=444603 RepID=A0A9N9TM79_PHYSR|nr:unnamed protein product [Phyllotreta striolata]
MSCRIILDNPGAYHPGDTVYGRVALNFRSRESFRGVRCKFRGREHTAWTERESYYDSHSKSTKWRTVHYSGDNKFLAVDLTLLGDSTLNAGHYEYPFSFTFPRGNIPNPYNGSYGYIKYYIKGYVDKAFAFDYEDEVTLHLIAPINFNDIVGELQLQPMGYQEEKTTCCCCCAGDPITMDAVLEKEAFVVGESARMRVDISNLSNESLRELTVKLKLTIESKVTHPSTRHKYNEDLLAYVHESGVGAHGQRTYNIDMCIPPSSVVPNFAGSYLFKQWCDLEIEAVVPGCHTNLSIKTQVKLGHIPLLQGAPTATYIPAVQSPGGPFGPPPPVVDVPPPYPPAPYPPDEKAPPYPTGPPSFPTPTGYGEAAPGMPMPFAGESSGIASAPAAEGAPSAPSKAKLADEDFELIGGKVGLDSSKRNVLIYVFQINLMVRMFHRRITTIR